jgi:predicted metal-dependent hydrolase
VILPPVRLNHQLDDRASFDASFGHGLSSFNLAEFFAAHEDLEDAWRLLPREHPSRKHLQGLVQLAVAFHHESGGNLVGARSVLERAIENLRGAETSFPDLDFDQLRISLTDWQKYLASAAGRPNPPQIVTRHPHP